MLDEFRHRRHLHPPRNVYLYLIQKKKGRIIMADAILAWQPSPSATVTNYSVVWQVNGVNFTPQTIPRTAAQDASGYTLDFDTANPTVTLNPKDVVDATITAVDVPDGIVSPPVTPPPVTVPVAPLLPPQNVTLTLA